MKKRSGIWLMLVLACLGGCSSGRYVVGPPTGSASKADLEAELQYGDWIRVEMRDGGVYDGEFVRADGVTLFMDIDPYNSIQFVSLARQDIISIEKKSFHLGRTVLAAAGVASAVGVLIYIAFLNSLMNMGLD